MVAHSHVPVRADLAEARRRTLWIALWAQGIFMLAEVAGGLVFSSLALLADAAHMLSDVGGIGVALVGQRLIERPPSDRHSFGLLRAEVLAAHANAALLIGTATLIVVEAARRLDEPHDVEGLGLVVVATLGLVVNVVSARLISRVSGRSLNLRGAYLHMLVDAWGSVGAIVAGVAALAFGADRVDSVVSIGIALLVVWAALGLLRESAHVLLEGTPRGIDPGLVGEAMAATPGIEAVHHLHVWNLASDVPALSAHLVIEGDVTLHEGQRRAEAVKAVLAERFGIQHATLEVECHECPEPDEPAAGTRLL